MEKAALMQTQLRHNSLELQEYLRGLESWEEEVKARDESLRRHKPILKEALPPVRGQRAAGGGREKRVRRKKEGKESKPVSVPTQRIGSHDYSSWDKFDVEKACEEVDYQVQSSSESSSAGEEEEVEEEERIEEERLKQQAILEKEKGNSLFREGHYEDAVECYTRAVNLDPLSAVLPANRAMALLKLGRCAAAESDCSVALALDDSYLKAYLRRGTARARLGRLTEAKEDFRAVLRLDPANKLARTEIANIEKVAAQVTEVTNQAMGKVPSRIVSAVKRPLHLRSKKPFRRITIEDIGGEAPPPTTSGSPGTEGGDRETRQAVSRSLVSGQSAAADATTDSIRSSSLPRSSSGQGEVRKETARLEPGEGGRETARLELGEGGRETARPEPEGVTGEVERVKEVCVPGAPGSSIQFQADWKNLRGNRAAQVTYFKSIPPASFPVCLQQSLETSVFPEIISILHQDCVSHGCSCLEELRWLTKVQRFSVAIMFLSGKEKESVRLLFRDQERLCSASVEQSAELKRLASDFALRL